MSKRIVFEGVGDVRQWESAWYPERPQVLKAHTLGMLAVKTMTVFETNGSIQQIAAPGYSASEETLRVEERNFPPYVTDNIFLFFNSTHTEPAPKWNCHSFGYDAQGWRPPVSTREHIGTRELQYSHEAIQLVSFDELVPGDLYSITSSNPNERNYHSFIPLSDRPLALSTLGPDGPLIIADLHDLFTYYGGDRLYKIKTPVGGSEDIIPQLPRHLPAGTLKLPVYERRHNMTPGLGTNGFRDAFQDYAPDIAWLYTQALQKPPSEIPNYLGSGRYFHAFKLPSNQALVGKIALRECEQLVEGTPVRKFSPDPYDRIIETATALSQGFGHGGLEQMVAYSDFTNASVITECAGDSSLEKLLRSGEITDVPFEAYVSIIKTFEHMDQHQLSLHRVPSDIIYNGNRLVVIDYLDPFYAPRYMKPQTLYDRVVVFAGPRMLLSTLQEGDAVPQYALKYKEAVVDTLGESWGREINKLWRESGFILPKFAP